MEDIYQNCCIEEIKGLLRLKTSMLAEVEKNNKNLQNTVELLLKEIDELTVHISELGEKNNLLNEELAACKIKRDESEEGGDENEDEIDDETVTDDEEVDKKLSRYKKILYRQTKKFLDEVSYQEFERAICQEVIGQDISPILISVYTFLQNIVRERCRLATVPNRVLVTGPSGSGKGQTIRSLTRYFIGTGKQKGKIPILQIVHHDVSGMSSAGFKGKEVNSIPASLALSEGLAICFLSEFDKMLNPKITSKNNNISYDVQAEMLSILEGITINYAKNVCVRTQDTLFICDGSFDAIRREKKMKASEKIMGFATQHQNEKSDDIYAQISREDILKYGATTELIGRFNLICQLGRLSFDATYLIIDGYRKQISKELNIALNLSNAYISELIELSNGEFGCRLLYANIYEHTIFAVVSALRSEMKPGYTVNLDVNGAFELREVDEKMPNFTPNLSKLVGEHRMEDN